MSRHGNLKFNSRSTICLLGRRQVNLAHRNVLLVPVQHIKHAWGQGVIVHLLRRAAILEDNHGYNFVRGGL